MPTEKNIFITGITGHIGNALCRLLKQKGYRVHGLAHTIGAPNDAIFASLGMEPCYGDICDTALLKSLFRKMDVVVHCAAKITITEEDEDELERVNVGGTRAVVDAAASEGVKQLIHFSSIHAHDCDSHTPLVNEQTPLAINHRITYNRTKAVGENYVLTENKIDAITVIIPTGVIGPDDCKPSEMGDIITRIARNKQPFLVDKGFDWVDVRDVCSGVLAAIQKPEKRESYMLSGQFVSVKEIAHMIATWERRPITRIALPLWAGYASVPFAGLFAKITGTAPKFTRASLTHLADANAHVSSRKAQERLGYRARALVDTIADTLEWFRSQNAIKTRGRGV